MASKRSRSQGERLRKSFRNNDSDDLVKEEQEKFLVTKGNQFWKKCFMKRTERGLLMLPPKVEKKIYNLKKALRKKNLKSEEIKDIVRKQRRKEELKYRKALNHGCFNCRQPYHKLADCPLLKQEVDSSTGVCYACGSTEHKLNECDSKNIKTLPFAKCFLCGEIGHITKSCQQNPNGAYPKGGSCRKCNSIEHLIKDCPELIQKKDEKKESEFFLAITKENTSADAEDTLDVSVPKKKKVIKVVKF